jgi:PKD repeat protein
MIRGTTTISHSLFSGNVGQLSGGLTASGQIGNPITLTVVNSLFHNNGYTQTNTFVVGAEMQVSDANLLLLNNTFADPQLPDGAIFRHGVQVFRTTAHAHNNLFANYATHGLGHGDPAPVVSTLVEDHNLFFNAPLGNFDGNLTSGGNSLTADPRFVNAAIGNYRLRGDSPAIDAGLDSVLPPTLLVDLDGQPRRFDGPPASANLVDMGAYESRKVGPVAVPGGPYNGSEGSTVSLNASGSNGDSALTFGWDCTNDGVLDQTLATPTGASCAYPDNGSFTVRLVVTDGEPVSVTAYTSATIANVTPVVTPPPAQVAAAGMLAPQALDFALGSFTDPGADAPWTVVVNWGDSTPPTQFSVNAAGALPSQSHTYAAPGAYTITVTVTDKDNAAGSASFPVTVSGTGPIPLAGGPYSGDEGSPIALDASGSAGNGSLTFAWDCTNDGVVDQTLNTPTGASCAYPDNGSFTVRLTVTDQDGPASVTAPVTVNNVTPVYTAAGNQLAAAGAVTAFALGSFADPGADAPWTVAVNWGDSTPPTQFTVNGAGALPSQSHTYAAPGAYTVTVTVTDKDAAGEINTFGVTVVADLEAIYLPLIVRQPRVP